MQQPPPRSQQPPPPPLHHRPTPSRACSHTADPAVWICRPPPAVAPPLAAPRLLLFCVPQAGMGAWVYHSWAPRLAALGVEVLPLELPGRNSRRREPPATDLLQGRPYFHRVWISNARTSGSNHHYAPLPGISFFFTSNCAALGVELAEEIANVVAAHVAAVQDEQSTAAVAAAAAAAAAAVAAVGEEEMMRSGEAAAAAADPGSSDAAAMADGSSSTSASSTGGSSTTGSSSTTGGSTTSGSSTTSSSSTIIGGSSCRRRQVPYALFGHSLGGWVVYEVAQCLMGRALAGAGAEEAAAGAERAKETLAQEAPAAGAGAGPPIQLPAHVFVSGIRAPHLSAAAHDLDPTRLHALDEPEAFWAAFRRRYGDTNPHLSDPRVRQLVWPTLRADFKLAETYTMPPGRRAPLPVPLTVFGGAVDGRYTREQLEAWRQHVAPAATSPAFPPCPSSTPAPCSSPGPPLAPPAAAASCCCWRLVVLPGAGHDYVEKWQQQGGGSGDSGGNGGNGGSLLMLELEAALLTAMGQSRQSGC